MPPKVANDRFERGITERWCPSCDSWLPRDERYFQYAATTNYWFRRCRRCVAVARNPHREDEMALSRLVQQLEWLVKNVGWLEAHERIGVSKGTLSNWMNRRVRRVTPDNARKIVTAILVYREELRLQRGKEPSNKRINLAGT